MARTAQLWFAVIGLAMAATTPGSDGPLVVQCGSCRVAAATTEGVWRPLRQPGLVSRLKGGFQKGLVAFSCIDLLFHDRRLVSRGRRIKTMDHRYPDPAIVQLLPDW
jgi:hypothetical protein